MPDHGTGRLAAGRHAGVAVPLFSIPSRASWGIGEIPDIVRLAEWLRSARLDMIQLLPVNEMQQGQHSPYSALSAMAIDPIFIGLGEVEAFTASGGEAAMDHADRERIARARIAKAVDYRSIWPAKRRALERAFAWHLEHERETDRTRAFSEFLERERWWLDDYSLFRALHDENGAGYWVEWEPGVRHREPQAIEAARHRLGRQIRFHAWLQWIADEQWQQMRGACAPVAILGDFPFVVSGHSADVWARQHEFRVDASVGVPPDAFSETGQDWGLPAYRWDVVAAGNYEWLRQRARRSVELFDGFRVDHLVGFYRTFVRERDGQEGFHPPDEPSQLAQGERVMELLSSVGARIIAEDLGTVPDFVRQSLSNLNVPGMKVIRWERYWHDEGQPFRDPRDYPANSVATTATHDTETLSEWWDCADIEERTAVLRVPALERAGIRAEDAFSDVIRDALLELLFDARSDLVLVPMQDVFGWRDRINIPASVGETNWSWRLPWAVEDLTVEPEAAGRAAFLAPLATRHAAG